jgi:hypothetical protein
VTAGPGAPRGAGAVSGALEAISELIGEPLAAAAAETRRPKIGWEEICH